MADANPASVLGTPVATVDTPGTAMIPLSDPGSNVNVTTPPPTDVQTVGTPGTAMVSQPTQWTPPQPGQVATIQSPQPDAEIAAGAVHQNWLSHILDTVGTILGGDKTIVATKHPDGTVSVEHNPSTTGEKWGRIAEAALGGAARGMAVGQGPGGAGKAFGAGAIAGLQQNAQQLAAANLEAKNMNAQQLAIANMALTHQSYLSNAEQMRESKIKFTQEQADHYNAILKATRDAPGSEDLGSFVGVTDLPSLKAKYPQAYAAHLGQNDKVLQFDPQIDPVTLQQTGSHITLLSRPLSQRLMPTGTPPLTQSFYDPTTHSIQSRPLDIDPTIMTSLEYSTAHQNLTKQNSDLALSVDKDLNKTPTTGEGATIAGTVGAATAAGTSKAQALLQAGKTIAQQKAAQAAAGREPTATPGFTAGTYVQGVNPVLDDTADGLASGRYLQSTLPKRTGKGQPTPQEQNYAANIVSQQKYGLPYNSTIIDQENTFAKAPKTQAYLEGIDRMTGAHGDPGQLNQLLNLAQAAGIGGNAPINDVKQAIRTKLGSQAADNFATLLTETQSNLGTLIGNPLLGSGESDQKLRTAQGAFGQNPTLDSLRGQAATVTDVLTRARNNMAANNRYIQQRYGTRLSPGAANAPATNTPAANTGQAARASATGYVQGVNSAQFPIAQNADGHRTQWNGAIWAALP